VYRISHFGRDGLMERYGASVTLHRVVRGLLRLLLLLLLVLLFSLQPFHMLLTLSLLLHQHRFLASLHLHVLSLSLPLPLSLADLAFSDIVHFTLSDFLKFSFSISIAVGLRGLVGYGLPKARQRVPRIVRRRMCIVWRGLMMSGWSTLCEICKSGQIVTAR
jgi:hypothetical protein